MISSEQLKKSAIVDNYLSGRKTASMDPAVSHIGGPSLGKRERSQTGTKLTECVTELNGTNKKVKRYCIPETGEWMVTLE